MEGCCTEGTCEPRLGRLYVFCAEKSGLDAAGAPRGTARGERIIICWRWSAAGAVIGIWENANERARDGGDCGKYSYAIIIRKKNREED